MTAERQQKHRNLLMAIEIHNILPDIPADLCDIIAEYVHPCIVREGMFEHDWEHKIVTGYNGRKTRIVVGFTCVVCCQSTRTYDVKYPL